MNIIEFNGDPMLQIEKFNDLNNYIFNLNQESFEEIKSYSKEVKENIPHFFDNIASEFVLLAEGGIDEEGNEFPDTFIGIGYTPNNEYPYILSAIYAEDFQYVKPKNGQNIYLKNQKNNEHSK